MKLIGLDVGTKRIGVAKADSSVRIAIPYSAIEVDGTEFKKIASLARAWDISSFVLGLPRNSKGEETAQSRYVRKFAKELKEAIPSAKICFQDESLTSVEAEKRLKGRKKGYKKGDIDSEAATIILQDFLEEKTGKSTTRAAAAKHRSVKAAKPHRFATAFITILVLLGLAGGAAYAYYSYNLRPVTDVDCNTTTADECDTTVFAVESGAGVSTIASELKEEGLIRDPLVFQIYFRLNSKGESLKAGEYEFSKAMSVDQIAEALIRGSRDNVFSFTVFPGETLQDIRKKLTSLGYLEPEVDAAFTADYSDKDYSWVLEGRPEGASLEGYLFGETYEFYKDDTPVTIVGRMIEEMAKVVKTQDLQSKFAAQGLNLYQGITLASVVQKEANNAVDQAKVAKVFLNRLTQGMNLGSDVTFKYALDLIDPNRETYSNADVLTLDNPYNTRNPNIIGLPFGPISNPGIEALNAVATPDESASNYLFFLTGDDGMMYYSSTYPEHEQNKKDHCQEYCNIGL